MILKKRNLLIGAAAVFLLALFLKIPEMQKPSCALDLPPAILLSVREQWAIPDFDPESWEIKIADPAIATFADGKITARSKGATQISFTHKSTENCFRQTEIKVTNINSATQIQKSKTKVDLPESATNEKMLSFPQF